MTSTRAAERGGQAGRSLIDPRSAALTRALLVASGAVTLVWLLIVLFWDDAPFALTFDDAWYYFTIARNIAGGKGSTFDQINLTNGYHPLWMLICTVPFKLGLDGLQAARLLLAFQVVAGWGTSLAFISLGTGRLLGDWPAVGRSASTTDATRARKISARTMAAVFALAAINPFMVKIFVNGLESGISVTCFALLLYLAIRCRGRFTVLTSQRLRLGTGVLLAFTFLARTDTAFLGATLGIWCLVEMLQAERRDWLALAELLGPISVVVAAYLLYNRFRFDTWVQISGLVKRSPIDLIHITLFALVVLLAALGERHSFRRSRGDAPVKVGRFPRTAGFVAMTGWFAAFCVIVIGYYMVIQSQQWLWYYAPVAVYLLFLLLLAVADITEVSLRERAPTASPMAALLPVQGLFGAVLLIALVVLVPQFADPDLRSLQKADAEAGRWISANLPADAVLASWDAGVVGYFAQRRVINLDGVVNSHDYYVAASEGPGVVARFLGCRDLRFVVNHGADVNGEDPDIRRYIAELYGVDVAAASTVIYTLPFTYSGITTGSAGTESGTRQLAVHIYALPGDPSSRC